MIIEHGLETNRNEKQTMKNRLKNIDLSIPRRRYYSDECSLTTCPECGTYLVEENCTILISAKSDSDGGEFMTNLAGSHFCKTCPVVVFDTDKVALAAKCGVRSDQNLRYIIAGIINLDSIPTEKSHLEIGGEGNPVPLVRFLPDLNNQTVNNRPVISDKTIERNDPCLCGSGKKYKKCCGK
jgi:hypothetical protein